MSNPQRRKQYGISSWHGEYRVDEADEQSSGMVGFGDILEVDLTAGTHRRLPVTEAMARDYIGGQGIGSYLLSQYIPNVVDPLGPDNVLILSVGQLDASVVPSASRSTFLSRSPNPGTYLGMSNGGGMVQLRNAGFDQLVMLGKAEEPVYIKITDEEVELVPAHHLWGRDTYETVDDIWSELGDHYEVACIGPAGENLVRHAAIIGDKHVAWGRTGLGAVMGSKNLKAIVVSGTQQIQIAKPVRMMRLCQRTNEEITGDTESIRVWRDGGTWKWIADVEREVPRAPSEVFDLDMYDEKLDHRPIACPGCPVGCKHALKVREGLKHAGLEFIVGCTSGTMCGPFGAGLGVVPVEEVAKCAEVVQRLGMDSSSTAGLISLLLELHDARLISSEEIGIDAHWGDEESIVKLMNMIARREGIGGRLADGSVPFVESVGPEAVNFLVDWKGMARAVTSSGGQLRSEMSTANLAWAVNFRGHMDRHRYPFKGGTADQPEGNIETLVKLADHLGIPADDVPDAAAPKSESVPRAMRYIQDYNTVAYCLGFCDRPVILNALAIERMAEMYRLATGIQVQADDLLRAARRIWNLEKVWVTVQGQTRQDDYPSERYFIEESQHEKLGEVRTFPPVSREVYDQIMNDYYDAEGWHPGTGLPRIETLEELGLGWLVEEHGDVLQPA